MSILNKDNSDQKKEYWLSFEENLTQTTTNETSLSEATNCYLIPANSNEGEKPSCSSSNAAFKKSPQTINW